jgi:hypothetical protein
MAKGRKRSRGETFESEVHRRFDPVAARLGFVEAEITELVAAFGGVQYVRDGLCYWWNDDSREGCMWVTISLVHDGDHYSISLEDLVVGAHLGTGRDVESNSRTWLVLQRAIESHTTWLERLHPRLTAPDAHDFILGSGGRLAMPDAATYHHDDE